MMIETAREQRIDTLTATYTAAELFDLMRAATGQRRTDLREAYDHAARAENRD